MASACSLQVAVTAGAWAYVANDNANPNAVTIGKRKRRILRDSFGYQTKQQGDRLVSILSYQRHWRRLIKNQPSAPMPTIMHSVAIFIGVLIFAWGHYEPTNGVAHHAAFPQRGRWFSRAILGPVDAVHSCSYYGSGATWTHRWGWRSSPLGVLGRACASD